MTAALDVCKLLLDEERLRIIGLLVMQPRTHAELLDLLSLKSGVLARHLYQLRTSGLVGVESRTGEEQYHFNEARLHRWKEQLFARPAQETPQSHEEEILSRFTEDNRLTHLPTQTSKQEIVLAWLAERFEPGTGYPEATVNEMLSGHGPDYATLRRALVDVGFLRRAGGIYHRTERKGNP